MTKIYKIYIHGYQQEFISIGKSNDLQQTKLKMKYILEQIYSLQIKIILYSKLIYH